MFEVKLKIITPVAEKPHDAAYSRFPPHLTYVATKVKVKVWI